MQQLLLSSLRGGKIFIALLAKSRKEKILILSLGVDCHLSEMFGELRKLSLLH
jgi:hypothetical protein